MRTSALLALFLLAACDSSDPAGSAGTEGSTGASTAAEGSESSDGAATTSGPGDEGDESTGGGELPTPTGPELFVSLCSGCHGVEAEGGVNGYELRHPDRGLASFVIRNGREGLEFPNSQMAAYGEDVFSDQQLEELFDWLDAFEQPSTGEGLYADYCANCHGTQPGQGVINEDIADKGFNDTIEKVREGEGGSNYGNRGGYMSAFDDSKLSDAEVQAIVDWMGG